MVLCDSCSAAVEATANYCPECGAELNPDIKDWADGFLSLVDRGHIQQAIDGNESPPAGYHERLHEVVRHSMADFCLLDRWDEFDNAEALIGDLSIEGLDAEYDDEFEKLVRLTCPFQFVMNAVGLDAFETLLEVSVLAYSDEDELSTEDISVSIDISESSA